MPTINRVFSQHYSMVIRPLAAALVLGLTYLDLHGQQLEPEAQVPPELRELTQLGDLQLRKYSIHGYGPLVVFLTEATQSAPESERRYRHELTSALMRWIQNWGYSVFSLSPNRFPSDSSKDEEMEQNDSAMVEVFRGLSAGYKPRAVIGFGSASVTAARMIAHESAHTPLVMLVPSTGADTTAAARQALWDDLRRVFDWRRRPVLILESPCNRPAIDRWMTEYNLDWGQTILLLPQYDRWLGRRTGTACSPSPPTVPVMSIDLGPMIADWIKRKVGFPS